MHVQRRGAHEGAGGSERRRWRVAAAACWCACRGAQCTCRGVERTRARAAHERRRRRVAAAACWCACRGAQCTCRGAERTRALRRGRMAAAATVRAERSERSGLRAGRRAGGRAGERRGEHRCGYAPLAAPRAARHHAAGCERGAWAAPQPIVGAAPLVVRTSRHAACRWHYAAGCERGALLRNLRGQSSRDAAGYARLSPHRMPLGIVRWAANEVRCCVTYAGSRRATLQGRSNGPRGDSGGAAA